ncbi:endonuclease [Polaribacter sp. M15]
MNLKLFIVLNISSIFYAYSQAPTDYYNTATASGYTLKTQLKNIISNGHIDQGYGALYDAYETSDTDSFYENDNSVLDMYSENPNGTDSYNYQHGSRNCGNYNSENDCYNREHIFPQGFFNSQSPMKTDIHHVVPSDGYVNGRRSNYPFGEVANASWTSNNGSKVGSNTFGSFTGTVFEPIDEFKGDIARMLFYFATRYEDEVTHSSWDNPNSSNSNPLNGTNNQVYEDWYLKLLYKWHTNDPVSNREIVRNDEAFKFQGNRNPFIDHPEFVSQIWGNILSTNNIALLTHVKIYPNPSSTKKITINIPHGLEITSVKLYSIIGSKIYEAKNPTLHHQKIAITDLKSGVYLLKVNSNSANLTKKVIIN